MHSLITWNLWSYYKEIKSCITSDAQSLKGISCSRNDDAYKCEVNLDVLDAEETYEHLLVEAESIFSMDRAFRKAFGPFACVKTEEERSTPGADLRFGCYKRFPHKKRRCKGITRSGGFGGATMYYKFELWEYNNYPNEVDQTSFQGTYYSLKSCLKIKKVLEGLEEDEDNTTAIDD